jgi:hypothetical protein
MNATADNLFTIVTPEYAALNELRRCVEACDFAGYDPYDALNSPVLRLLAGGSKWARLLAIQAVKRFPFNLRPLLLYRPGHNPKALGLFLEGYVRLHRSGHRGARARIASLLDLLERQCRRHGSGHGWGYNFDWQSRVFFVPRGLPNGACTSFVGHALLDTWETLHEQRALDLAVPIAQFLMCELNRVREGDAFCFSYTPVDTYAVHNVNLLCASLLIRLYTVLGDSTLRDTALSALTYSMKHQQGNGSWYYSERTGFRWIDSFHTGFNLESIRRFLRLGQALEHRQAYYGGREFYVRNLFLPDGSPKYFHDRLYPIDIHSGAEAISFFSAEPACRGLARRVLSWVLANMYDGNGRFYFQKHKRLTNRIAYVRWSQAWMFRALTAYLETAPERCAAI